MNDHEIVLAIHAILDATEWSPDTIQAIADILQSNGYPINDSGDEHEHCASCGIRIPPLPEDATADERLCDRCLKEDAEDDPDIAF